MMNFKPANIAQPVLGRTSVPDPGHVAIMRVLDGPDGSSAYHIAHIATGGKSNKEIKQEVQAYLYGNMSTMSRISLQIRGHSPTSEIVAVRLYQALDALTWDEKTVVDILPSTQGLEVDAAAFKAGNMRAQFDLILASTEDNSTGAHKQGLSDTMLVLLVKTKNNRDDRHPRPGRKGNNALQLADLYGPGSHGAAPAQNAGAVGGSSAAMLEVGKAFEAQHLADDVLFGSSADVAEIDKMDDRVLQ